MSAPTEPAVGPWSEAERQAAAALAAKLRRLSPFRQRDDLLKRGVSVAEADAIFAERVADLAWRGRGIVIGDWVCKCGAPYTAASYPSADCTCGRPYPSRCMQPGCGRVVEAREIETVGDRLSDSPTRVAALVALPADGLCPTCSADRLHRARATTWAGSSVPPEERAAAPHGWWADAARAPVHEAITAWLDNNLGRDIGVCALYLWGAPGRGKTRAAADAAYRAVVVHGLVSNVTWTSQAQIRAWHDQRWQRDTDRARVQAEVAESNLERIRHAHFLVVDDLFTSPARAAFAELLADLVRDRLNARLPTIYTSNHRPEWSAWLETDGRIDSRWSALGRTVEVLGRDWRRG